MSLSELMARFILSLASILNFTCCNLLSLSQTVRNLGQRRGRTVFGNIQSISPKVAL